MRRLWKVSLIFVFCQELKKFSRQTSFGAF